MARNYSSSDEQNDHVVEIDAGKFVFSEGELGTEMYIIREGRVEILQQVGGESRQIAVLEKGDFFGEMAVLEDLPRNGAARALTPVKLVRVNGAAFDSMLRRNPEIAVRIMRKLSRRLRDTDRMLREALGQQDVRSVLQEGEAADRAELRRAPCRLVHSESGLQFPLCSRGASSIGRRDPVTGIRPDVDLTGVDSERSSSRSHAKVRQEEDRFFLVEDLGATNGTFVNGSRLQSGVPIEIRTGDLVRFGLVEFTFYVD